MSFNSLLSDQLSKLDLKPQDFKPTNQKPRCVCHNKYLFSCPISQASPPTIPQVEVVETAVSTPVQRVKIIKNKSLL